MRPEVERIVELREQVLARVREVLITELSVTRAPDEIDPDAPLFAGGIGLDSVDGIELVVAVERAFDVQLPDGEALFLVTASINRIVDFVVASQLQSRLPRLARLQGGGP